MTGYLIAGLLAAAAAGQAGAPAARRVEIQLERLEGEQWKTIEPGLVLRHGDKVRFRFRADFDGYLYVMNQGTSGRYELLFPREETGEDNRIRAGEEYRVPATQSWFKVDGPPGYDIVYWMVTPLKLGAGPGPQRAPMPPPPGPVAPSKLRPRCDDAIFRARGVCVDSAGGPRNADAGTLPSNLAGPAGTRSRELIIMRQGASAVIAAPEDGGGPLVYEYRLPHE
jgi:hypothetical protein